MPDDVTTALQDVIDRFPECFFADSMVDITRRLAKPFRDYAKGDEVLLSYANELELVGQQLQAEGGEAPSPDHQNISGLYCGAGSEGRTRFLSAYAKCYRRQFTLGEQRGSIWNAQYWLDAAQETFTDASKLPGNLAKEWLTDLFKGLWPILAIIVVAIVALVFIAFATKGKISVAA